MTMDELIAYFEAHDLTWQIARRRYGNGWRYGAQVGRGVGYSETAAQALERALARHEGIEVEE